MLEFGEETAYFVDNYRHDHRWIMDMWDGKQKLVAKVSTKRGKRGFGEWRAPVGLLPDVLDEFDDAELTDRRRRPGQKRAIYLDKDVVQSLRDYQSEAVEAFLEEAGIETGKGSLKLPTRSGKTVIAAGIISRLGLRTLFIVQSKSLLTQTFNFFQKVLKCRELDGLDEEVLVGMYGNGIEEIGWVTVVSIQTITKNFNTRTVRKLLRTCDLCIFDECHHLTGNVWRQAFTKSDAFYKLGLSATIVDTRDEFTPDSSVWMVAATGPILFSLEASELIEAGWLCRPCYTFHDAPKPREELDERAGWHEHYRVGIVENTGRNELIAHIALEHVLQGDRVLVTLKQVKHMKELKKILEEAGMSVAAVIGLTKSKTRDKLTLEIRDRKRDVLIGTVFGEGVDLPWLDVVIIGGAMQSEILTVQRQRNLTPYNAETNKARLEAMKEPVVVKIHDFVDMASSILASHSLERLRTYSSNEAGVVKWDDRE